MTEQLPGYVMADTESTRESARLALLEAARDPATVARLEEIGVCPGWRCLEVGAGRGSIARWLAARVGPAGSVVAADIDPRFLTGLPANVELRVLDIREHELEPDAYDLVHCRALLMHLPEPAAVLRRLARALRRGGVLFCEEGDYGLYDFGGASDSYALTARAHAALDAMSLVGIMRPYLGRRLPALLTQSGLELLGTHVETPVGQPGDAAYEFARASAHDSLPRLVAAGIVSDGDLARLDRFFDDPDSVLVGPSLVAAWGQRRA